MTQPSSSSSQPSVMGSLKYTVLKTLITVGVTVLLIALLREGLAGLPWIDHVSGGHVGATILQTLAVDGIAQRQQVVAIGLMVVCFGVAVLVVRLGERLWQRS